MSAELTQDGNDGKDDPEDPYIWLEDVEAEECLDFAKDANDKCLTALGDPTGTPTYDRVLSVLESKDRIPHVSNFGIDPKTGDRVVYNFWRDDKHVKGIWRKTTLKSYQTDSPEWTTVLDVDELAEKDGISWVYKGSRALPRARDPENNGLISRVLLSLSRGGSDAIHLKEFDMLTGDFVPESDSPFILPEAKIRASYKSRDVLLVGSDFGEGTLTDSGYARTIREWTRGTPVEEAPVVWEGEKEDVAVSAYMSDERIWGGAVWQVHSRSLTFYTSVNYMAKLTQEEQWILGPAERKEKGIPEPEFVKVDIQDDADMSLLGTMLIITLRSDWTPAEGGSTYKTGSVIYCNVDEFLSEGKEKVGFHVLFEPTDRTAYEYYTCTKNYLVLATMDNVKSKLQFYKIGSDSNKGTTLTSIEISSEAQIRSCSVRPLDANDSDEFWYSTSDYTTPSTLFFADASLLEASSEGNTRSQEEMFITKKLKSLPDQYDASKLVVEQRTATSKDGTQVPYFIIMPRDTELNGKNPVLLYGYGGFEISLGPHYLGSTGLAWLERGGIYVEANIRGGGEFGPAWHQAALKANRNKAYEDFFAVGEDLVASKICSPKTLAAKGGSNGGLLMGNCYVMRPDLFGALHCAVPLLDMKRYHTLLAGASWMAEYGDPSKDWDDFLHKYSPYHNIDASRESYPPMLVTTSTRDDRVHPAHARKMVKKLWDMGEGKDWPIYYYENIEGGHGGAANAKQSAFMSTLAFDFLFDTLTKNAKEM